MIFIFLIFVGSIESFTSNIRSNRNCSDANFSQKICLEINDFCAYCNETGSCVHFNPCYPKKIKIDLETCPSEWIYDSHRREKECIEDYSLIIIFSIITGCIFLSLIIYSIKRLYKYCTRYRLRIRLHFNRVIPDDEEILVPDGFPVQGQYYVKGQY